MDTLNYVHSKGLIIYDIKSTHIAVGISRETLNKIFFLDFASSVPISAKFKPKHDLILFGLILLELNGVRFPHKMNGVAFEGIENIVESLLKKWDEDYAKVKIIQHKFL